MILLSGMALLSCNKASKVVPEAKKLYQEYRAASKSNAIKYHKMKNNYERAQQIYEGLTDNTCNTCNGYGVVYLVNEFGTPITDYYGNYQYQYCPCCGGTGQQHKEKLPQPRI